MRNPAPAKTRTDASAPRLSFRVIPRIIRRPEAPYLLSGDQPLSPYCDSFHRDQPAVKTGVTERHQVRAACRSVGAMPATASPDGLSGVEAVPPRPGSLRPGDQDQRWLLLRARPHARAEAR